MAVSMPTFAVNGPLDVFVARTGVRRVAAQLGFPDRACQELAIVVSELSSNILKYGVRGSIEVEPFVEGARVVGVTVAARDVGPPFRSFETALVDGNDDRGPIDPATLLHRGGLGTGLGAVSRLTDRLHLEYDDRGKRVVATRLLSRDGRGR